MKIFTFNLPSSRLSRLAVLAVAIVTTVSITSQPSRGQSLTDEKPPKQRDGNRNGGGGGGGQQDSSRTKSNAGDSTRAELKKRFEARFDEINELKDKAFIGETFEGYVAALDDRLLSRAHRQVVEDENTDRKALYGLIAERVDEGREQVPPRVVAERNARRNFEKASARHFLKNSEHRWFQKRDENRATRIARMKKDGIVGETSDGTLESIKGNDDDDVKQMIEQENRDRRAMYDQIAGAIDKANAQQIARQLAREAYEHLPAGHSYKSKDGAWERKPARQR